MNRFFFNITHPIIPIILRVKIVINTAKQLKTSDINIILNKNA